MKVPVAGVRAAYEWLDAQAKIGGPATRHRALKHIIEKWAGHYVSEHDVVVAALLHPDIKGTYSRFHIRLKMTRPSQRRLENRGVREAAISWPAWPEAGEGYRYTHQET